MKELTPKETQRLRDLFWILKDAQIALQKATNEIAKAHGIDPLKERYQLSDDFRTFVKIP